MIPLPEPPWRDLFPPQNITNCSISYYFVIRELPLSELSKEGYVIHSEAVAALSPYLTQHIIRFGRFVLDRTRRPLPLVFDVPLFDIEEVQDVVADAVTHDLRNEIDW